MRRRVRTHVRELRKRAVNSLVLAIELFNRPHGLGRAEAVLMLLHHAFELLLKAIIKDQTGVIHDKDGRMTYGFDRCLRMAHEELKILSEGDKKFLSVLDLQRDAAVHYYQDLSEDLLYLQAQAGTALFDHLLRQAFNLSLADIVPSRVLPVSTKPPMDLQLLVDSELSQIDSLLGPGSRKGIQAVARLRPILALAKGMREETDRVSENELRRMLGRRKQGEDWQVLIPQIAQLRLAAEGSGIPIYFKIHKDAQLAVRVAREGEPVVGTVIKQEINVWDKFNMSRDDLAQKLGISGPRTSALIVELGIQEDPECFKELRKKSLRLKGYSKKALDRLRNAIEDGVNIEDVWQKHRYRFGAGKRKVT